MLAAPRMFFFVAILLFSVISKILWVRQEQQILDCFEIVLDETKTSRKRRTGRLLERVSFSIAETAIKQVLVWGCETTRLSE